MKILSDSMEYLKRELALENIVLEKWSNAVRKSEREKE